jgi:hypothetical protein
VNANDQVLEVSLRQRRALLFAARWRQTGINTIVIASSSRGPANMLTLSCKPPHVPTLLRRGGCRD